jgi:hypothetical protein
MLAAKMISRAQHHVDLGVGIVGHDRFDWRPTCASNGHARFRVTENPERSG